MGFLFLGVVEMKKLLSVILAIAMIICTVDFISFAQNWQKPAPQDAEWKIWPKGGLDLLQYMTKPSPVGAPSAVLEELAAAGGQGGEERKAVVAYVPPLKEEELPITVAAPIVEEVEITMIPPVVPVQGPATIVRGAFESLGGDAKKKVNQAVSNINSTDAAQISMSKQIEYICKVGDPLCTSNEVAEVIKNNPTLFLEILGITPATATVAPNWYAAKLGTWQGLFKSPTAIQTFNTEVNIVKDNLIALANERGVSVQDLPQVDVDSTISDLINAGLIRSDFRGDLSRVTETFVNDPIVLDTTSRALGGFTVNPATVQANAAVSVFAATNASGLAVNAINTHGDVNAFGLQPVVTTESPVPFQTGDIISAPEKVTSQDASIAIGGTADIGKITDSGTEYNIDVDDETLTGPNPPGGFTGADQ